MTKLIEPRTLRGFRDYPPALMIPRERVLETARRVYRSYGFAPVDTPALEYAEVLLGKGGGENDKIVYRFQDHGDRDVALRFDLTVPFARFAAQYVPKSGVPFKRYAMGPVWRGENTGHGRYREFWQCDFDTIGTTSNASDIETVLVINDLFTALEIPEFTIRVNNRLVLNGLLEALDVSDRTILILRSIDKLPKIGRDKTLVELLSIPDEYAPQIWSVIADNWNSLKSFGTKNVLEGLPSLFEQACSKCGFEPPESVSRDVLNWFKDRVAVVGIRGSVADEGRSEFLSRFVGVPEQQTNTILDVVTMECSNDDILNSIRESYGHNSKIELGQIKLRELLTVATAAGVPDGRIKIDLSIARGLDYYTGTIVETFLGGEATDEKGKTVQLAGFGSVCSGGRYDNLASLYTKQVLPGVGASLGVDRLLAAMETMRHPWLTENRSTPADVLIVQFRAERLGEYQKMARELRAAGIATEVYPEAKKLAAQFQYADKRGFRVALVAGPDDFEKGVWQVKNLANGEQTPVPTAELATCICSLLGG